MWFNTVVTHVTPEMFCQVRFVHEGFVALMARVRPLTCVTPDVCCKVGFMHKCLPTLIALKRSLSCVTPQVRQ